MRRLALLALLVVLSACGDSEPRRPATDPRTLAPEAAWGSGTRVALLGDSLTAGTPSYEPISGEGDPRSQYGWELVARLRRASVRNCGVNLERVRDIAARRRPCTDGAAVVVVQGGINDIAQGADASEAAAELVALAERVWDSGARVAVVELLPWNNGDEEANRRIVEVNRLLRREIGAANRGELAGRPIRVVGWYEALRDPETGLMEAGLTVDGDHPTVEGYRRLGVVTALAIADWTSGPAGTRR